MHDETIVRHERFMRLLTPIYDQLTKYIRAIVRDTEDARDILGETLLRAYETLERLDREESFRYYLFTIARRCFWSWKRRKRFFLPMDRSHALLPIPDTAPDVQADLHLLYDCIHNLPLKQAEALVLYEISGFSMKEIQVLQGGSLDSAKSRVARARLRLMAKFAENVNTKKQSITNPISIQELHP
jgi:RNA polymerase sigma-70 factor, ECF subfamily